jgi:hypothetical protein
MTASTIRLRTPWDLLALIPYVIGFYPDRSIVLMSLRMRRINLTERVDLPCAADASAVAERMIRPLLSDGPDSVLLVGYETDAGESLSILQQLAELLSAPGIPIVDRIVVCAGRWRSLDCDSPDCCPPEGSRLPPPSEAAHVVAEFVGEGVGPLASRAELEAVLEAGPAAARVAALIAADDHDRAEPLSSEICEALAQAWIRLLDTAPGAPAPASEDVALVLLALKDVRVRDGLVALVMPSTLAPDRLPEDIRDLVDTISAATSIEVADPTAQRVLRARLIALCQLSPDGYAPPPLTLFAAYAWWCGDGATALVSLARALRCDPDYRLARLLDIMLDLAIRPPSD